MDNYIVTFKDVVNARLLDEYGAVNIHIPKHLSFIALCEIGVDKAMLLNNEKEVKAVERDAVDVMDYDRFDEDISNQGESYVIDLLGVKEFHDLGIKGQGIKVAVFDSGIQKHEDLVISGGINAYDQTKPYDENIHTSHGTLVAGVIGMRDNDIGYLGVAPECELYAVKLDDNEGSNNGSRWSEQIIGMNWAIENNIDVINCSFSGFTESVARREAFKAAHDAGITIFCSAGNKQNGTSTKIDTIGFPSRYPFVITTANITSEKVRNASSCVGSPLNFSSGGTSIPGTTTDGANTVSNKYRTGTGTSYANPSVAGIFALYKQMFPNDSRKQLLQKMYVNAERIGDPWLYGAGIPRFPHKDYSNIKINMRGDV